MCVEYKLVATNNNDNHSFVVGIVYLGTNQVGTFTLELTIFPSIKPALPGSPFITKYSYQINFDKTNINKTNLSGFNVIGTFSLNSGTFFNLSPLGLPYGKYENIAINMDNCYSSINKNIPTPISIQTKMIIEKNNINEYECIVSIE